MQIQNCEIATRQTSLKRDEIVSPCYDNSDRNELIFLLGETAHRNETETNATYAC